MTPFELTTKASDGVAMIVVRGDLDYATAPRLRAALEEVTRAGQVVLVDLSATDFMDCAGVGPIVVWHQQLRRMGGDLVLDSPSGAVRRLLEVTGLLGVITVAGHPGED